MSETTGEERAQALWHDLLDKEWAFFKARVDLMQSGVDLEKLIDQSLMNLDERAAALRQLAFLQEPRQRQFLPVLIDIALQDPPRAELVKPLIRSLDRDWSVRQLPLITGLFLGKVRPETDSERQKTALFLYALDPRLHAAFEEGVPAGGGRA